MPTKEDTKKLAKLIKDSTLDTLSNLAEHKVPNTPQMRTDIYMKIFEIVEETVRKVGLNASNEFVNCAAQIMYSAVEVNGEPIEMDAFEKVIDPRTLPENERPFIYAFFDEE